MNSIELMMEEHKNIKRTLSIIRKMCISILNKGEVPFDDFKNIITFVRNYADKHHHNKEEEILFKKMTTELGPKLVEAPLAGMLVEHDFGRLYISNLEKALERVSTGDEDSKVDIIANAIGYADLLTRHIDKEDKVIYNFAKKSLNKEALEDVDIKCEEVEKKAAKDNLQNYYINLITELESKWI